MVRRGSWLLIFIVIVFQAQRIGASLNIDLAVIFHDGAQKSTAEFDAARKTMSDEFPKLFNIGVDKTRVAIVANHHAGGGVSYWGTKNLTGDITEMKGMLKELPVVPLKTDLATAFTVVQDQVFAGPVKKPRVVLLITFPSATDSLKGAKPMKADDILFFVVFQPSGDATADAERLQILKELAGGKSSNVFSTTASGKITNEFNANTMKWLKDRVEDELCRYEQSCFYSAQNGNKCTKGFYTPFVTITEGDCHAIGKYPPVLTSGSCRDEECESTCDGLWPWSVCPAATKCGNTVDRVGTARWKPLDNCPRTLQCSKCTGMTPKATTDTPSTQPTTKGTSGSSEGVILGVTISLVVIALIAAGVAGFFFFLKRRKGFTFRKGGFLKGGWRLCKKGKKGAAKGAPKKGDSGKKASVKSGKKGDSAKKAVEVESEKKADSEKKATEVKSGKKAAAEVKSGKKAAAEVKSGSGKKAASGKGKKGAGAAPETEDEPKVKSMTTVPEAKVKSMTTMPEK